MVEVDSDCVVGKQETDETGSLSSGLAPIVCPIDQ